jgi:hypothetical protein
LIELTSENKSIPLEIKLSNNSEINYTVEVNDGRIPNSKESFNLSKETWIKSEKKQFELEANNTATYAITLEIPENAENGSYYFSVVFSLTPESSFPNSIQSVKELASVIMVNVSTDTNPVLTSEITELSVQNNFVTSLENQINISITNSSNYYLKPIGFISITKPDGQIFSEKMPINNEYKGFSPLEKIEQSFQWKPSIQNILEQPGTYKVNATVYLDANQKNVLNEETSFFYIPWIYLAIIIIVLTTIIVFALFPVKKI